MAKNRDWKIPHSDFGDTPMKEFKDPITGKRLNSIGDTRPQREVNPRPAGSDMTKKSNRDGST